MRLDAFLGEVADHAQNNTVEGDYFAAVMSLVLYLVGVISVIAVSLGSKYPFENHGIVTALMLCVEPNPHPPPTAHRPN